MSTRNLRKPRTVEQSENVSDIEVCVLSLPRYDERGHGLAKRLLELVDDKNCPLNDDIKGSLRAFAIEHVRLHVETSNLRAVKNQILPRVQRSA